VAQDLAAAFVDDPIMNWFLRDDAGRTRARLSFFRLILAASTPQQGQIERPGCGGAAALWIPSEHLGETGPWMELRALGTLFGACGLKRLQRARQVRDAMRAHHPEDVAHDYLFFLGVRPSAQGAGIGSRLLRARLTRLDVQGRSAFLETGVARTLPLYRSHGFEIVDEYRPASDGPTIWGLWRKAAGG
jgi:GNAT superfamily N-acetyltransferase